MANAGPNPSHLRALQRLCTEQAAPTTNQDTRSTLLGMAAAYRQQAERLERDQPERDCSRLLVAAPRSGTMGPAGLTHAIQSNALRCHSTVADRPNNRSRTGLCPLLGQTRNHLLGSSLCGAIRPVQQVQRRVDFSQLVLDFLIVRAWTPV
jgi:hypothetical protein